MAALNSWQKLTRVLPGLPFGNGPDGAYSSGTIPTMTVRSCSGSAGASTLTIASGAFSNNDIVLIHQTRGTGVGQWEINRITSGGGTTSLTLQETLHYTYTDSGSSQAQVIKVPQYTSVTQSGTWSLTDWDGNLNGILVFACAGTTTVSGTISASSDGFVGGTLGDGSPNSFCAEGSAGAAVDSQTTANGSGGGAGSNATPDRSGGGGGNAAAGSQGGNSGGAGGIATGAADLTSMTFGGGGGGGWASAGTNGGDGGGIVAIFTKVLSVSGTITSAGGTATGSPPQEAASGGGAGGSILIVCQTAALGTNKITAPAGSGGVGASNSGGAGSVGRIAVHHSGTVTGTTNPTFTDTTDSTLVETGGGFLFNLL